MNKLPALNKEQKLDLDKMTPSQIVSELDKYIIGQKKAKRIIAVALRNRQRRKMLQGDIKEEINPKNIIMIGPTGVGKTEIARRISKLFRAPFIKVEATKYTEVGYVGRDVESMVRDLASSAYSQIQSEMREENEGKINKAVNEELVKLLLKPQTSGDVVVTYHESHDEMMEKLLKGELEDRLVEIDIVPPKIKGLEIGMMSSGDLGDMQDAINSVMTMFSPSGSRKENKKKKVTVSQARDILYETESEKAFDADSAKDIVKKRVEEMGIIFIDEIDKIAGKNNSSSSPDISREGVQRDILPIVEGCKVNTKFGTIDTTHILFIAAGAFHVSKPSDLIPELQGRFPLRVELDDLSTDDFYRILTETKNAPLKQYEALIGTEGVKIVYEESAIKKISQIAYDVNRTTENIGARRLYTIMEKVFDDISFNADQLKGQTITITADYVESMLKDIMQDQDLSRYIL